MELIAAVMKAPTSAQRFEDAKTMLNYGFSAYALTRAGAGRVLPPIPVELGAQATVQPVLEQSSLLVKKEQAAGLKETVALPERVKSPVRKGDALGTLTVASGGETLAELPITAGETVPRITWSQMALRLLRSACCAG